MKFTLSWLLEYLDTESSIEEICLALTNIGLEVESVDDRSQLYNNFNVAKIISAQPCKESKKLKICQVKTSNSDNLIQVICGAANARDGIKVAMADIGAVVPSNQMEIKRAKIAGYESCGMLCSARELGLGGDDEGIIEIDEKWQIGTPIAKVFGLDDAVIEINVTPNRGDCLGVYGIARDLAAYGIGKLKELRNSKLATDFKSEFQFENNSPEKCSDISFCHLKNINNQESPDWLKNRLLSVGINPISAIVDITNYVMLTFNQPMHAYDASRIDGKKIFVRFAKDADKFLTLKDQEVTLDNESLIIADDSKILSIAGIIGGKNSACDLNTNQIIFEVANFDASTIARTGRKLNILTDSRYRFERGCDSQNIDFVLNYAINLVKQICGGQSSKINSLNSKYHYREVKFNIADFKKIIGVDIDLDIAIDILKKLGFELKKITNLNLSEFILKIPSWRHDISIDRDIIEEIIRIYGYDKIINFSFNKNQKISNEINIEDQIKSILSVLRYNEVYNWSFVDSKLIENFCEFNDNMILANPISNEMDYLRPCLAVGMLQSFVNNSLRGFENLSLFEVGSIFTNDSKIDKSEIIQKTAIGGIRVGKNKPEDHYKDIREYDFFDIKFDVFELIKIFGIRPENIKINNSNPLKYYHPYRFANLYLGKKKFGHFGEIHPMVLKEFGIKRKVYSFEIYVDDLPKPSIKAVKPYQISDFQSSVRDFAFLIDNDMPIGELLDDIYKIDRNLVQTASVFDIYRKDIIDNKKSIALRVTIQSLKKTLTSQEIDDISNRIIDLIETKYQASLRR